MNPARAFYEANLAHRGQMDKTGVDYILHPVAVAQSVALLGEDFEVVALLHDVWEDTDHELHGLTPTQHDALDAITQRPKEPHDAYISRCRLNFIARVVKIADIRHNLSEVRLALLPGDTQERLRSKYNRALNLLLIG